MKLWLDDERPVPPEFNLHAKTAQEAMTYLEVFPVHFISLDHDLGVGNGTGYDVAQFIERSAQAGTMRRINWAVHSANPVGKQRIIAAMQSADRFWTEQEDAAV